MTDTIETAEYLGLKGKVHRAKASITYRANNYTATASGLSYDGQEWRDLSTGQVLPERFRVLLEGAFTLAKMKADMGAAQ